MLKRDADGDVLSKKVLKVVGLRIDKINSLRPQAQLVILKDELCTKETTEEEAECHIVHDVVWSHSSMRIFVATVVPRFERLTRFLKPNGSVIEDYQSPRLERHSDLNVKVICASCGPCIEILEY